MDNPKAVKADPQAIANSIMDFEVNDNGSPSAAIQGKAQEAQQDNKAEVIKVR